MEQCNKSLCNNKYEYTEQPEDLILDSVVRRFKNIVENNFETESASEALADTLNKCEDASLKRERLCNFFVLWKLHEKACAQGVMLASVKMCGAVGSIREELRGRVVPAATWSGLLIDSLLDGGAWGRGAGVRRASPCS